MYAKIRLHLCFHVSRRVRSLGYKCLLIFNIVCIHRYILTLALSLSFLIVELLGFLCGVSMFSALHSIFCKLNSVLSFISSSLPSAFSHCLPLCGFSSLVRFLHGSLGLHYSLQLVHFRLLLDPTVH